MQVEFTASCGTSNDDAEAATTSRQRFSGKLAVASSEPSPQVEYVLFRLMEFTMGSAPARPLPVTESALATFSTTWLETSTAAVSVHGELDAANAAEFIHYVSAVLPSTDRLVLDLSAIRFFGTAAFSALHTVSVRAAGHGVNWVLIPSREVTRLLRICDPDAALPAQDDLPAALACVRRGASGFPRLVRDNG
jgi:anti-anti-sigma factor